MHYLRKGFRDKISVIPILDTTRENFRLSQAYENKVDVINIITAPEIEMQFEPAVPKNHRKLISIQELSREPNN